MCDGQTCFVDGRKTGFYSGLDRKPLKAVNEWVKNEIFSIYLSKSQIVNIVPIVGDWNAKVGSQETPGVTGKFGLGVQNEAEQKLIEFCQENALVLINSLFQQHQRRLYTWSSPDGQHQNQIDHIHCSQRWRSTIQTAKARPGADCGSDHELLIAKFRLKLKKVEKTTRPFRYDWNQMIYDYTLEVRNRLKKLGLIDRVPEELWTEVRDIVQETGNKTIPKKKKCKRSKMAAWGGLTNSCEKKKSEKKRKKGKIFPFECRVPKNSKER